MKSEKEIRERYESLKWLHPSPEYTWFLYAILSHFSHWRFDQQE